MIEPRDGVIDRSFAVLGCFDERHISLTLAELSRRTNLPVNTTLRIARNLMAVGALERGDDGRFSVGLRLFEIAALAPRGVGLRPAAMPFMLDLRELTGQHVLLTVREGREAVLVERLSTRGAARVQYRIGGRMPLSQTGGGLVLLAYATPEFQQRELDRFVPPRDEIGGLRTTADLRRTLSEVRRLGSFAGIREHPVALETVAVPVMNAQGVVVAALTVVGAVGEIDRASLVTALATSARAISRDAFRRS